MISYKNIKNKYYISIAYMYVYIYTQIHISTYLNNIDL